MKISVYELMKVVGDTVLYEKMNSATLILVRAVEQADYRVKEISSF